MLTGRYDFLPYTNCDAYFRNMGTVWDNILFIISFIHAYDLVLVTAPCFFLLKYLSIYGTCAMLLCSINRAQS